MADANQLTPYIATLLVAAVAWLFKTVIQLGKDFVRLQTSFEFYVTKMGQGAALVLDHNPAPPEIRILLQKHYRGVLGEEERGILVVYLEKLRTDAKAPASEKLAAFQLLATVGSLKRLSKSK